MLVGSAELTVRVMGELWYTSLYLQTPLAPSLILTLPLAQIKPEKSILKTWVIQGRGMP